MLVKPNRTIRQNREQNTLMRGRLATFLVSWPTNNLAYTNANIVFDRPVWSCGMDVEAMVLMYESFRGWLCSSSPNFWPKEVEFS